MTPAASGLDADRILALAYVPRDRRPAVEALWQLDLALGRVLAGGRDPMLSRIKLVWWRDSLERLDHAPAPGEPVLQALAAHVLPLGVSGADLAAMEEGWTLLLADAALGPDELAAYARARGGLLFRHSAILLGRPLDPELERAGEAWALIDLARHSNEADARAAFEAAAALRPGASWPAALRPLGMLGMLAARDAARGFGNFEPQGAPGRMLRMLGHRLTGR